MTHLFAANSCGQRRHTALPADPISPALPMASATKPSQELEEKRDLGPGAAGGLGGTPWGPGLRWEAAASPGGWG